MLSLTLVEKATDLYLTIQIDSGEVKSLVKFLVKVYDQLEDDTMVMIAFTGRDKTVARIDPGDSDPDSQHLDFKDLSKGKCFLKLKCTEMDLLECQVKELYQKIKLVAKD